MKTAAKAAGGQAMINIKVDGYTVVDQTLAGRAPQLLDELLRVNISVLRTITDEAGKGQPLSDTIISFAQEMILTVQMEKNKIDELIKR
jgi:hypothetical protein